MALVIAQRMFCESGLQGYELASAGVMATDGTSASVGAMDAVAQMGLDLSGHSSRALTPELVCESGLILTMTQAHKNIVCSRYPDQRGKVHIISEYAGLSGDVSDPFGGSLPIYAACRDSLTEYITLVTGKLSRGGI